MEGAIIDLLSPASRMAVLKPPPHDRLLAAVQRIAQALLKSNLEALLLDLENGLQGDYWSGRLANDRKMISMAEAEEFVERKLEGIKLLKQVSDMLATTTNRPLLRLCRPFNDVLCDQKEFQKRVDRVRTEAEKYGWLVDTRLRESR